MRKFAEFESLALEFYKSNHSTKEDSLMEIKDRGIYYWDEGSKLLDSIEQMELPAAALEINTTLKNYCALRKEAYELMYKQVVQGTKIYQPKIDALNAEIDSVTAQLNKQNAGE